MSDHLIINDTFGKSRAVLEEMTGQDIKEFGSAADVIEKFGNIKEICQKINSTEIKGIEEYARQFQAFVNGFPGTEAPYIFAGMKVFLDAALSAPPFTNPDFRQKYDMLLETLEKNTLRVVITQKVKREP